MSRPKFISFSDDRVTRRVILALILIFLGAFFVLARIYSVVHGTLKVESELQSLAMDTQTGTILSSDDEPFEVIIELDAKGEALINEEKVTGPWVEALIQMKSQVKAGKVMVTLSCHEQTPYHRVLEVMEALKKAKLDNVTLTVGTEAF